MPLVELVYDRDCPNVAPTRARLLTAFARAGVVPRWSEYLGSDVGTPAYARGLGSPTILVDGRDPFGGDAAAGPCCRTYRDDVDAPTGIPPLEPIVAALREANRRPTLSARPSRLRAALAMGPAIGAAFLPKVACPACWPAYAGILGALGLGALMDTAVILPLTTVFLLLAVGVLAFRARARRGYRPFALGAVAAFVVLLGKFAFDSDASMYAGLGLLVVASLWNSWPRARGAACPSCPSPARADVR